MYYKATVNKVGGEIQRIELLSGEAPEEVDNPNNPGQQYLILDASVLVAADNDPAVFSDRFIYNFNLASWVRRPDKPNPFATWEVDKWDWDTSAFLDYLRMQRDRKLLVSDWTVLPDSPLTQEQKDEAILYRQALRDVMTTVLASPRSFPTEDSVPWPTPPEFINN